MDRFSTKHTLVRYIIQKSKIRNSSNAGQIFRITAQTLVLSKHNAIGAFYRRIQFKKGKLTSIKSARKLAALYYIAMTKGIDCVEYSIQQYGKKGSVKNLV
ncbi:MAG: hypothetical protein AB1432_15415 [Bacteroidota bacterium]